MDDEEIRVSHQIQDAVGEAIRNTEWAPPDGGVLVDVLCVMLHVDAHGDYGVSWVSVGSQHQAYGMARDVIRGMDNPLLVLRDGPGENDDEP